MTNYKKKYYLIPCFILFSVGPCARLSESGEAPYITSAGFQFLLLDTASQLWYITLQYLKTAQVRSCNAAPTLV